MASPAPGGAAHLASILALPFNVLVTVPAVLLGLWSGWRLASLAEIRFWVALGCFGGGLGLMATTIRLFARVGRGTLAPWNPTQRLVVEGVYRRVRNPMISGVLLNLLGEAVLFGSLPIAVWLACFFAGNNIYFSLSEEPGLEARFGDDYRRYKAAVPRWIPRRRPWPPNQDSGPSD